jgi:hypothetical protein
MSASLRLLVFPLLFLPISCSGAEKPVLEIFPGGQIEADLMPVVRDPVVEAAGERFAAATDNADWWQQHTQTHGALPPYDERMNVTAEEYESIIHHLEKISRYAGKATFWFEEIGPSRASFTCRGKDLNVENIVIDLGTNVVETPFGTLQESYRGGRDCSPLVPPGPVFGTSWALPSGSPDNELASALEVEFLIGTRYEIGKGVIYYRVSDERNPDDSIELLLHYNLDVYE